MKNLLNQIRKCCTHKDSHVLIKISGYDDYNGDSKYWINFSLDCAADELHQTIVEGKGSTPDEAIKNLVSQIEGKTIRFYERWPGKLYKGHFFDVEVAKELKIGS